MNKRNYVIRRKFKEKKKINLKKMLTSLGKRYGQQPQKKIQNAAQKMK